MSDYSDWLVWTDWRYRLVYTVDFVAHWLLGPLGNRIEFPLLCNWERHMYHRRLLKKYPADDCE